ncbi:MAG: response regulator [bacterium]
MARILLIDDMRATRATISEMLQRGGYDVIEAENGKEGLKLLAEHSPNAVITDILMPEMDGIETIRAIHKMAPSIPIVAITASSATPYLDVALKMGAARGLLKPFKQAELLSAVEQSFETAGI